MYIKIEKFIIIFLLITICIGSDSNTKSIANTGIVKSLILPGWSHLQLKDSNRHNMFFITESILWLGLVSGNYLNKWNINNYNAYAELHANVDMSDKNYLFAYNISYYDNFENYNSDMEIKRETNNKYDEGEGYEWDWDSESNRLKFNQLRRNSLSAQKLSSFAIAGLLINRFVSAIDYLFLSNSSKKSKIRASTDLINSVNGDMIIKINFKFD